ncbi:MAG: hypothetical protein ACHQIH_02480 [Ignavibacteria bacterium]
MDLEKIRESTERYSEEISKAYYLQGAGLKTNIDFDDIYNRYSGLFSGDNLQTIKDSLSKSSNSDESKRANSFLEAFYGEIITQKHKSLISELLELESTSEIEIESDKTVPYRSSMSYLLNEPSAFKRQQIEQNIESFVGGKLNCVLEESFLQEEKSIRELGFANKIEMFTKLSGIDLYKTDLMMQDFIKETDELYSKYLGLYSKKVLNMNAEDLKRHDLLRIMRASNFDTLFPKDEMLKIIYGFVSSMGIDINSNNRINLDIEPRLNKSARAFCSAVRIPDEVYLVVYPRGGESDYSVFLHELGHALHFSNINPDLEFEYKWYGDNSVTEAYAMTFDHLTVNEAWMNKFLNVNMKNNDEYFIHSAVNKLISLRMLGAKIHYEIKLYETPGLNGKKEIYRENFERTHKVHCSPVNYLVNIDNYFYCVRYIRAWMLQVKILDYLNQNYGELWFENRSAGNELLSWWSEGQKYNAEELCEMKGWSDLSASVLIKNINEILKNNKYS